MPTSMVRKMQLGNELRWLREAAGLTAAEVARTLDSAQGKISRIELGQSGVTMGDLMLLLDLYAVEPDERQRLVDLERDADDMRVLATEVVPGLFQTEAYMRVLCSAGSAPFAEPVDVDAAVASRLERQEVLDRADPPLVSCVLSESCVRRIVGDRQVMAEQLLHLAELVERPRVQLQLHPFDAEVVGGCIGQRFTLIRIPAARASEPFTFAYCEDLDDARYIDDGRAVRVYEVAFAGDAVLVRDSKQRGAGPVLTFIAAGWAAFVAGVERGEFDRR